MRKEKNERRWKKKQRNEGDRIVTVKARRADTQRKERYDGRMTGLKGAKGEE